MLFCLNIVLNPNTPIIIKVLNKTLCDTMLFVSRVAAGDSLVFSSEDPQSAILVDL